MHSSAERVMSTHLRVQSDPFSVSESFFFESPILLLLRSSSFKLNTAFILTKEPTSVMLHLFRLERERHRADYTNLIISNLHYLYYCILKLLTPASPVCILNHLVDDTIAQGLCFLHHCHWDTVLSGMKGLNTELMPAWNTVSL